MLQQPTANISTSPKVLRYWVYLVFSVYETDLGSLSNLSIERLKQRPTDLITMDRKYLQYDRRLLRITMETSIYSFGVILIF